MEFRVPIQMTELIIKAALPGYDSQRCIIHTCYLAHRQFSWVGLCMYTPSQLHQPAILHFDECYICKQNECLMIQQGHIIFNFSLIVSCIRSNSATFYCDSLSSKTESEVFNTSLLILYASAMMLLYVSTTLPNFCLVLVARLCCSTPCRFTGDMSTTSKLSNRFHFIRCIIQSILINVIHWSLLHHCVRGTCIDDVFITSYVFTAKHVTWLNTDIFCFKLLRHIKDNHFRSFGFSSMNLQYTTALGCMSLKDVTKHLSVVQTNNHIFTMTFQQTCSSQINSLGVFTVVDKCFNAQDLV